MKRPTTRRKLNAPIFLNSCIENNGLSKVFCLPVDKYGFITCTMRLYSRSLELSDHDMCVHLSPLLTLKVQRQYPVHYTVYE